MNPVAGVFLSNRGLKLPFIEWEPAHCWALLAFVAGIVADLAVRASDARSGSTPDGQPRRVWPAALALIVGLPLAVWAALRRALHAGLPALRGFNFRGGITVSPEFFALLLGLVTYTAGFIAEIVRAGIQAVPQGQWEAARGARPAARPGAAARSCCRRRCASSSRR